MNIYEGEDNMEEFKAGKINKYILNSKILERDITLSIYLPEDFTELFKSQVIICFDGLDFSDLEGFSMNMNV